MKPDELNMAADRLRDWINEQRLEEIDAMRVIALVMGDIRRWWKRWLWNWGYGDYREHRLYKDE